MKNDSTAKKNGKERKGSGMRTSITETGAKKVAIYVRVSTEDQAKEGYSLEAQLTMLRAHCSSEGIDVAREYVDDGYSGRDTRRPAYRQMLSEKDQWDSIIVLKMDRIHRNSINFMSMMEFLNKSGKGFVSSSESLDTDTATGRFVVDMMQRIAQLESEQIGERTYMGMKQKAEQLNGKGNSSSTMGFTAPFGYEIYEGQLVMNGEEFRVVEKMFRMYADDCTMEEICYRFNRDGIQTRKGNVWNKYNLRNILHNPVYAGYMRWGDMLIPHNAERAVSPKDFNSIQQKMLMKVRDPAKKKLSGVPDGMIASV